MVPKEIRLTIPPSQVNLLEGHRISNEFHQEVQYRQEFERHCQWYEQTAQQHRQELQKMRGILTSSVGFTDGISPVEPLIPVAKRI